MKKREDEDDNSWMIRSSIREEKKRFMIIQRSLNCTSASVLQEALKN